MRTCPVCKSLLKRSLLEAELPATLCSRCGGIWISANEYVSWLSTQRDLPPQDVDIDRDFDLPYPVSDNGKAICCPDCGRILRRYRIWPNMDFYLDRCSSCNGIWFDKNEWQTLQSQNLHNKVNVFFTEVWQRKLRSQEMKRRFQKMYRERFGTDDYRRIREIKAWLGQHPEGRRLLAYLTDSNPYKG